MTDNIETPAPVDSYTVDVEVLIPQKFMVQVPKVKFAALLGPSAFTGLDGRLDSLLQGYIERNRETLLPEVPTDALITRADPRKS